MCVCVFVGMFVGVQVYVCLADDMVRFVCSNNCVCVCLWACKYVCLADDMVRVVCSRICVFVDVWMYVC